MMIKKLKYLANQNLFFIVTLTFVSKSNFESI